MADELQNKGDFISEIYNDFTGVTKWYKRFLVVGLVALVALLFVPEKLYFAIWFVTFPIIAVIYTVYYVILKSSNVHLKAYHNGVDFKGLGFLKWNEMGGYFIDSELFFFIDWPEDKKASRKGVGADHFFLDKETKRLCLKFSFSKRFANKSVKSFCDAITPYLPTPQKEEPEEENPYPKEELTWRSRLFNKEDVKWYDWVTLVVALYFLCAIFYMGENPYFFPSEAWVSVSKVFVVLLTVLATLKSFHDYFLKPKKMRLNFIMCSRISRYATLFFTPVFLYGIAYFGIQISIGYMATSISGVERVQVVTFHKDEKSSERCLKSDELRMGMFGKVCVKKDFYVSQPNEFKIPLKFKESWFGQVLVVENSRE